MAIYSIRDLEKLSGVKAHTIRMWEKRYQLLKPRRTDTNIRYYLDEDVKVLLNTALLNRNGYKISKIAKMTAEEMSDAVLMISAKEDNMEAQSDALTLAMLELDEAKFNATLQKKIDEIGFKETMLQVILPFLNRLSILWMTGSIMPVQENYIAGLIKQKIYVAIDQLPLKRQGKKFMLFLPEGEDQELSLLFVHYLCRNYGHHVVNLGQNVSLEDLRQACKIHQPEYLFTLLNTGLMKQPIKEYIEDLSLYCRNAEIIISGLQLSRYQIKSQKNYHVLNNLDEIIQFVDNLNLVEFE